MPIDWKALRRSTSCDATLCRSVTAWTRCSPGSSNATRRIATGGVAAVLQHHPAVSAQAGRTTTVRHCPEQIP